MPKGRRPSMFGARGGVDEIGAASPCMGKRSMALVAALLALVAAAALLLETVVEPELLVADGKGALKAVIALPDGTFDHVFVHSVHKTGVVERFRVETEGGGAVLRLYELRYEDAGVGMPSDAEGGYRLEVKEFVLVMNRTFKAIPLRVSPVPGHGVRAAGVFHPFIDLAGEGEALVLSARMKTSIRLRR